MLNSLKDIVLSGWLENPRHVLNDIWTVWTFREEIGIQNGTIYKGWKMIIPKLMQNEMLEKIHKRHYGTAASIWKIRDVMYWSNMSNDITSYVRSCTTCAEFTDVQQKQPLQTSTVPSRLQSPIAVDLFMFNKKHYMITVDNYSDYFEIDRRYCTTTCAIVKNLKNHFARHGILNKVMTNNEANLFSDEFAKFAESWNVLHTTSSPYYSRSNGKAEATVKIAKALLQKVKRSKLDFWQALLDWGNFFATYKNETSNNRKVTYSKCFKTCLNQSRETDN